MCRSTIHNGIAVALLCFTLTAPASSQVVRAEADILSPGDDGYDDIPPNLLVIDLFVDIATTDTWAAAGLVARADNGTTLQYFDADANTPGSQPGLFNPGMENRFVTCLSRPRGRDESRRFTNGGAAAAGGYDPPGALPDTQFDFVNVGYFASPPATPGSPSVDGYIARFALDISATGYQPEDFTIALSEPATEIFFECAPFDGHSTGGFDLATFDYPFSQMFELDFWVTIPEPATCAALLVLFAPAARRSAHHKSIGVNG